MARTSKEADRRYNKDYYEMNKANINLKHRLMQATKRKQKFLELVKYIRSHEQMASDELADALSRTHSIKSLSSPLPLAAPRPDRTQEAE